MKKQFTGLALIFMLFLVAAGAPSPLYTIFQQQWHFSTIVLTVVFSVYAFSLLAGLLITGSLSDYIGRRPVLLLALGLELASMALLAIAPNVAVLLIGRLLQGFATGVATAVLSGALFDSQPKETPGLAPLMATIVPVAGLGIGAYGASLLVQYAVWPTHLVFWMLCACLAASSIAVFYMKETVKPKPGWAAALKPTIAVPVAARSAFKTALASMTAGWALGGLYLSLGPSIAARLLSVGGHLVGGLVILAITGSGAISVTLLRARSDGQLLRIGTAVSSLGLLITIASIYTASAWLFFVGTVVAGIGFGPAFAGSFRSIMSKAEPRNRAGLASAVYIVSYIAFGLPAILAGIAVTRIGLHDTVLIYCAVVVVLYMVTLVKSLRHSRPAVAV